MQQSGMYVSQGMIFKKKISQVVKHIRLSFTLLAYLSEYINYSLRDCGMDKCINMLIQPTWLTWMSFNKAKETSVMRQSINQQLLNYWMRLFS